MKIINLNKSIKKEEWKGLNADELEEFIEEIFSYYRQEGFPYFPTDDNFRKKEYNKLLNYDFRRCIDYPNKAITQSMHGLSLCWSYMPHSWEIRCNNKLSPMEAFSDDNLLKKVIRKRLRHGTNLSHNGIRKMLKIFTGVQSISNFRPTSASAIYSLFTKRGDIVWDMSSGFGGRLLGSHVYGVKYIGTEPCYKTYQGLVNIDSDFKMNADLYQLGSEDYVPVMNSLDFCFTSPPYFNTERYSNEPTQSYKKYPSKEEWCNVYLYKTFSNAYIGLKPYKKMAINICNVPSFKNLEESCIKIAHSIGFELIDEWKYALSNLSSNGKYKYEPIFIFIKR